MTDRIEELNMILTHMWNSNFWYTALENASLLGLETKQALMRVSDEYDALRNSRAADHITTIKSQAAEISRLTAALKQVQHSMAQVAIPGNDARREFELIRNTVNAALLRPQPQPAQEPETPVLSRYAAEQVRKAAKP